MRKSDYTFNSIEEMVTYTVNATKWTQEKRWKLEIDSNWVCDDLAEGEAWEKEWNDLWFVSKDSPDYEKLMERKEFLRKNQPSKHIETHYYLYAKDGGYHGTTIVLSDELGKMIDSVWTKKPPYQGSKSLENFGAVTLAGILKKLGKTDISKAITEARVKEKARLEKISRNNIRQTIRRQAIVLYEFIQKNGQLIDINTGADLETLMNIKDEE